MNKLGKLVFAASAVVAFSASAQVVTDIQAKKPNSAYVQDSRGVIVRDPFGLCWRTGYWTPADAVPGCDAPICVEPEKLENGKCVAPPPPPVTVADPAPAPAPAPAPVPTSEKVSYSADAFFDFDKAVLKPAGAVRGSSRPRSPPRTAAPPG